jgi:hypothetical protein
MQTPLELHVTPEGDVTLNLERLEHVGIKNIGDLKNYTMSRIGNRVMHLMEFADGGTLEVTLLFVAPNAARLEVFRGNRIALRRVGNDIIVGQMGARPAA